MKSLSVAHGVLYPLFGLPVGSPDDSFCHRSIFLIGVLNEISFDPVPRFIKGVLIRPRFAKVNDLFEMMMRLNTLASY